MLRVSISKESLSSISYKTLKTRHFFMFFLDILTELDTCPYKLFFSQISILSPPKVWHFLLNHPVCANANLGPVFREISKEV